jgi:hypothetical protein
VSGRALKATGAAPRGDGENGARAAKIRRTAWLLGGLAAVFYFGYMAWIVLRATYG